MSANLHPKSNEAQFLADPSRISTVIFAIIQLSCSTAYADFKAQSLQAGPENPSLPAGVFNCGSLACSDRKTNVLTFPVTFNRLPACDGQLEQVYIGFVLVMDPIFDAGVLAVPAYDAGVNANLEAKLAVNVPNTSAIERMFTFNGSGDFNTLRQEFAVRIDYPPQSVDTGFVQLPQEVTSLFQGEGQIQTPATLTLRQESTVSQIGMAYQFQAPFLFQISALYQYAPLTVTNTGIRILDRSQFEITFPSTNGGRYIIESRNEIASSLPWTERTNLVASSSMTAVQIRDELVERRFFRVRIPCQ